MTFTDPYLAQVYTAVTDLYAYAASADSSLPTSLGVAYTIEDLISLLTLKLLKTSLTNIYSRLALLISVPTLLSSSELASVTDRYNGFGQLANEVAAMLPSVVALDTTLIPQGASAVLGAPSVLDTLAGLVPEAEPSFSTGYELGAAIDDMAAAWEDWYAAIDGIGTVYGVALDRVYQISQVNRRIADHFDTMSLSLTASAALQWNSTVAVPSMLLAAASIFTDATKQDVQSYHATVYHLRSLQLLYFAVAASYRQREASSVSMGRVLQNDDIFTFAVRETGDYSNWTTIVEANDLVPPYIATTGGTGVASPGDKLYLNVVQTTGTTAPDYAVNFLGTDIYLGPIDGSMPSWTGDFALVSGIDNLTYSLARRVLTPRGTLVYHADYGSMVPTQIGRVQSIPLSGHIGAYVKSALLSDPRVQAVPSVTLNAVGNGVVEAIADVQPQGIADGSATLDLVLQPAAS